MNNAALGGSKKGIFTEDMVDKTSKLDKVEELFFINSKYKYTRKAHIDSAHFL